MAEVYPQSRVDSGGKVDYELKLGGESQVLIEAKRWTVSLGDGGENQLAGYCREVKPKLAVLTNGNLWRLYLPPTRGKNSQLRPFLEFDITLLKPVAAQENFERFLARINFETKTAAAAVVKEAKRLFDQGQIRKTAFRRMTEAWNSLTLEQVGNFLAPLAGYQPDDEVVKDFLDSVGVPSLVNQISDKPPPPPPPPRKPHSFTFQEGGEIPVKSQWSRLLVGVCLLMHELHPDDFRAVLLAMPEWFTVSKPASGNWPKAIGDTGIYAHFGDGNAVKHRLTALLGKFEHPLSDLTIKLNSGEVIRL